MISSGSRTLAAIVRHGYSPADWNTYPYARFRRASSGVMPLTDIRPEVGFSNAATTRRKVVFPQPDGPISDMKSPLSIFSVTLLSALTTPS